MRSALLVAILVALLIAHTSPGAEHDIVDIVLPTDNDALFHGGGPEFYQYIERDYHGEKSTPWEASPIGRR